MMYSRIIIQSFFLSSGYPMRESDSPCVYTFRRTVALVEAWLVSFSFPTRERMARYGRKRIHVTILGGQFSLILVIGLSF